VLPIAEIPYTVNGKKVELAVKKILAGQQVGVHHLKSTASGYTATG
jgi:hypothetical protein